MVASQSLCHHIFLDFEGGLERINRSFQPNIGHRSSLKGKASMVLYCMDKHELTHKQIES